MEDITWDRIDKQKFFVKGIGMFSGVTTLLFPLTVIKTRQMANHDISGGLQGMKDTVRSIWRNEGVPGFYRGFATVICGTIPARMVYLTSLEVVKDGVSKIGHQLDLTQTAIAGIANFAGGAAASLSTQLVAVPIDVVSQRQMVHGDDTASKPKRHPAHSTHSTATSASGLASPASPASSAAGAQQRGFSTAHHSSSHSSGNRRAASAPGAGQQGVGVGSGSMQHRPRRVWHANALGQARCSSTAAVASPHSIGGMEVARIILKEEGIMGFYRGFGVSVATFVPNSAMWWGAYGVYQQMVSSAYLHLRSQFQGTQHHQHHEKQTDQAGQTVPAASSIAEPATGHSHSQAGHLSTREVLSLQVTSSILAGATASLITNPLDLIKTRIQVAAKAEGQAHSLRSVVEEILREDGVAGLWRGALPRMVNSAMWGTAMVSVYEFLKRNSLRDEEVTPAQQ